MDLETNINTPVLFLIFSRPDTTRRVFEAIRAARPRQLFIAADGPRLHKAGEAERCAECRRIVSEVDWPCEVHTLFRDVNLGCGPGVSGAITWFFEHVEEGIILEDDTLPGPGFFRFCSELLERYRHDTRVMAVSGSTLPCPLLEQSEYSYFFSNWDYIWGWATWRRAWKYYDYAMTGYDRMMENGYFGGNYYSVERDYMRNSYDKSFYESSSVTWWSYQWGFARKINSGLVAVPIKNFIVNIGLGAGATNTKNEDRWSFMKFEEMDFPLKHPDFVMVNRAVDIDIYTRYFTTPISRFKANVKKLIPTAVLEKYRKAKYGAT
ncbi:MAG TPA: nucleotide-diphospho-sugar transferase [Cyclobacteriaceae bacterium]